MKVYFSAAMTRYRKLLPIYQTISETIQELGHEITSQHVVDALTTEGKWIQNYDPEQLWDREMKRLQESDVLISEVTTPAFGVAFMMEEAMKLHKPLLSLYYSLPLHDDQLPLMLRGKPNINFQIYTEDTAQAVLKRFFEDLKS